MEDRAKFARMLEILRGSSEHRARLLSDPDALFKELGVDKGMLSGGGKDHQVALDRARQLVADAKIVSADDLSSGARKIGQSATRHFARGYDVIADSYGFRLLEKAVITPGLDETATGTTKCTWDPWDGCTPDADW